MKPSLGHGVLRTALLVVLTAGCAASAPGPASVPRAGDHPLPIVVNGVELHYLEQGSGQAVIFVHGGLADYREWLPTAQFLLPGYRTITYSRRYNFPNTNGFQKNHSAVVEAADLASLIRRLKIAPAHVVGVSYGGYTALLLALDHPELVRSLVVAEPGLLSWLKEIPGGAPVLDDFMLRIGQLIDMELHAYSKMRNGSLSRKAPTTCAASIRPNARRRSWSLSGNTENVNVTRPNAA